MKIGPKQNIRSNFITVALSISILFLISSRPVSAQIIYNNFGDPSSRFETLVDNVSWATGFTTGSSSETVTSATIGVDYTNPVNGDWTPEVIQFAIYTDSNGVPLSLVGAFSSVSVAIGEDANVTGASIVNSGITLAANTNYWFVESTRGGSEYFHVNATTSSAVSANSLSVDTPGVGIAMENYSTWTQDGTKVYLDFSLSGPNPAPEPSVWVCLVLGFAVLIGCRRVRRGQASR